LRREDAAVAEDRVASAEVRPGRGPRAFRRQAAGDMVYPTADRRVDPAGHGREPNI